MKAKMIHKMQAPTILRSMLFVLFMTLTLNAAIHWGVRQKSLWERFWDVFTGGGAGILLGLGVFIFVGAIGLVSGPVFGSLGWFALATIGGGLGFGVGGIVHILRNPLGHVFNWPVIVTVLIVGAILSAYASALLRDFFCMPFGSTIDGNSPSTPAAKIHKLTLTAGGSTK